MIHVLPAAERGHTRLGWLDSRHSFSFGDFHHPGRMGFRALRVINDDRVMPATGFATHPHRDMEILSYVLEGQLAHQDSLGNGSIIRAGELQRMTAGTGVLHAERNPSPAEQVHFLQIWILPQARGLAPGYEQRAFTAEERQGRLRLLASRDGREGSVTVHQEVALHGTVLAPGQRVEHRLAPGRYAWVQVARGRLLLNGQPLQEGDGAAVSALTGLELVGEGPEAEALLFDLG